MNVFRLLQLFFIFLISCCTLQACAQSQPNTPSFKVVAFYTAKNDQAHISFVHEANRWFASVATTNNFSYDSTNDWSNLNEQFLSKYQVVVFLDTRPDDAAQRTAFE